MIATTATGSTRVTLVGTRRRVDVVLPSAEPLAVLLPELLRLTGEPHRDPPESYRLVGVDGAALPGDRTLHQADVPDGAVLRLLRGPEVPSAAVVHDVADATTDDFGGRAWRWGPDALRWTCTAIAVVAVVAACAVLAPLARVPVAVAVTLLVAGAVVARRASRPVGVAVVLAGGAVGVHLALAQVPHPAAAAGGAVAAVAVTTVVLGACSGLGRGGVFGGAVALALLAVWAGAALLDLPTGRASAVVAVVAVLLLGALPRLAVVGSGLAALDDVLVGDGVVRRPAVAGALAAAHRGLTVATAAAAGAAGTAGFALTTAPTPWTVALACLTASALVLRLRAFPLLAQVVALLGGTAAVVVGLLRRWLADQPDARPWVCALLLVCAAAALLRVLHVPKEHVAARFRQFGDRLEAAVVIALVPVVLGEFGVYARLLATF
ncbi:type VII secretion integral membrane protein EccD [Saccharothrix xinjiangensis]|uniref:Type VII secretion integral membrane protein EccD n=1 Tax=Saccharothrix xinjiangensis TaxID=204798 RepID=A0ABV9Y791_9PSEU